jgi:TRAP-type C4-dicarboxylate transport system permease small subunit
MSVAAAGEIARAAGKSRRAGARPPLRAIVRIDHAMRAANRVIVVPCMLALLAAAALLTGSVVARYFLHAPTDWQEETSVLLLVGATFLSGAYVQEQRGHVAIDLLSSLLSPRLNRVRRFLADLVSGLFCAFFAWKSWTLFHEAWVEGQTSNSTFAPPMWIPYGLMAAGMTLLTLQIAVQLLCLSPAPLPLPSSEVIAPS